MFDRKLAESRWASKAMGMCAELGQDPNTNMTHIDHVFECLSGVAPRWKHVAYRLEIEDRIHRTIVGETVPPYPAAPPPPPVP